MTTEDTIPAGRPKRLFRCYNCADPRTGRAGRVFEAERGVGLCPDCGASLAHNRSGAILVEPLRRIHWEPLTSTIREYRADHQRDGTQVPQKVALRTPVGSGRHACAPDKVPPPNAMRTSELSAVTCPECLKAAEEQGATAGVIDPRFDRMVYFDADGNPSHMEGGGLYRPMSEDQARDVLGPVGE